MIGKLTEVQQLQTFYLCIIDDNTWLYNPQTYSWELLYGTDADRYILLGPPDNLQVYTDEQDGDKRVVIINANQSDIHFTDESHEKLEEL